MSAKKEKKQIGDYHNRLCDVNCFHRMHLMIEFKINIDLEFYQTLFSFTQKENSPFLMSLFSYHILWIQWIVCFIIELLEFFFEFFEDL